MKILLRRVQPPLPASISRAPKRKKLLESGFENEAGNEKREEGIRVD
jgi:hypothetical protein